MTNTNRKAVILDMDGVVTRTATLHAQAWKVTFDEFLAARRDRAGGSGENDAPFDVDSDYRRHVDGRPRLDGVRGFLESRGITLPEGEPDGAADAETVHGLGTRKNQRFLNLLQEKPVHVFEDVVEQLQRWRTRGIAIALITSSRNGRRVLRAAGLEHFFDVTVDGEDADRLGIAGKPAPDTFLHAAQQLGVDPKDAIVVEDALAGVRAGRAGGFGLVVGITRGRDEGLREAGADVVIDDLRALDVDSMQAARTPRAQPPSALDALDRIAARLEGRRLALFLDYDGTLTPIVRRPEDAVLPPDRRSLLRDLAARATVAIVSGRDLPDVRRMVGLDNLFYAGSHGFDVAGPGDLRMQQESARDHLSDLDAAEHELRPRVKDVEGAWLERKRFALALHYREAADRDVPDIERAVDAVLAHQPRLRKKGGKRIFELQPDIPWDKGRAVQWLLTRLDLARPDVLAVYLGDDVTDEDAFAVLSGDGVGIRVGTPAVETRAHYVLGDPDETSRFLRALLALLEKAEANRG